MLVLSRKVGERIMIGPNIVLKVASVRGDRVSLAFCAPESVVIHREEVQRRMALEAQQDGIVSPFHPEFA